MNVNKNIQQRTFADFFHHTGGCEGQRHSGINRELEHLAVGKAFPSAAAQPPKKEILIRVLIPDFLAHNQQFNDSVNIFFWPPQHAHQILLLFRTKC